LKNSAVRAKHPEEIALVPKLDVAGSNPVARSSLSFKSERRKPCGGSAAV
jgi:hypothetical protein